MFNHISALIHHRPPNSVEPKNLAHDLLSSLAGLRLLVIKYVFLKESVVSIHMSTVEKSVTIDYVIPEPFVNVVVVVVLLVFDVVLVRGDVFPFINVAHLCVCLNLIIIVFDFSLIEGSLKSAELFIEVYKNISATDLHQTFIARYSKNYVLFVKVREHLFTEYLVNYLPLSGHHALLVQVYEVDFYRIIFVLSVLALRYYVAIFKGIAERL